MRSRTESSTTALACCLLRLVEAKLRTDKAHCAARIVRIEAALGDNLDRVKFVLSSGRETPWFGGRLAHYLPPREVFAGICSETACGSPSGGSEMCSWDASEEELVVGLELEARAPRFVCETWPMRDDRRGSIPQPYARGQLIAFGIQLSGTTVDKNQSIDLCSGIRTLD